MDVLVKKIRYIRGIPEEWTSKAVKAGELKRGSIVGLDVEFKDYGVEGLIELKLTRDGQEKLVKEGDMLPVEEGNSIYYIINDMVKADMAKQAGATPKQEEMALKGREALKPAEKEEVIEPRASRFDEPVRSHF